jgi:hypothetical protein
MTLLNFILRFHWTFMDRRAREMWSACETRSRLLAHLMYSLAASQPIFPTLLVIVAGPVERSIAAAVCTCNTALCCCADMCVCVYERSRCVWPKLRIRLLICWFGFFSQYWDHIQIWSHGLLSGRPNLYTVAFFTCSNWSSWALSWLLKFRKII